MTRHRDIEPILDDWFADGPSRIADRVVDDTLLTIERTPQARRALRLPRRITMTRTWRLAAVAVAAVAVVAIGAGLVLRSTPALVGTASPSASPTVGTSAVPRPSPGSSSSVTQPATSKPLGSGSWIATGNMKYDRFGETATLLLDGRVLVAGGWPEEQVPPASAELYDPSSGRWSETGTMHVAHRSGHTATLLRDGKVLVAGGSRYDEPGAGPYPHSDAELYDPATGTWTETGGMTVARSGHTATLLPDGKVLVVGGGKDSGGATRRTELYDPAMGTWTKAGNMSVGRAGHTATLLPNGLVLVVSGWGGTNRPLHSAELYDPGSGTWTATASLASGGGCSIATRLTDGNVLAVCFDADNVDFLTSAELYDPLRGTWAATGSPRTERGPATLLHDGRVLVIGRHGGELYDPATGTWADAGAPTDSNRSDGGPDTATLLPDGKVLVVGVWADTSPAHIAELYDPGGTP